jgi:hypothetical protein
MGTGLTIHAVLAGAYKGKLDARALLTHASENEGVTALCGKVKGDNLCDVHEEELTCPSCIKAVARRTRAVQMSTIALCMNARDAK